MTELIRPALYGARHDVVALTSLGRPVDDAPAARPGADGRGARRRPRPDLRVDRRARRARLPPLRRGDLVAIRDAGAYGASLSSTYNGRPRPPQVILGADGRCRSGRRRGSSAALG